MKWVGWTWVSGSYRLEAKQAFYILHLGEEGAGQVGAAYVVLCNEVIALQCRECNDALQSYVCYPAVGQYIESRSQSTPPLSN